MHVYLLNCRFILLFTNQVINIQHLQITRQLLNTYIDRYVHIIHGCKRYEIYKRYKILYKIDKLTLQMVARLITRRQQTILLRISHMTYIKMVDYSTIRFRILEKRQRF